MGSEPPATGTRFHGLAFQSLFRAAVVFDEGSSPKPIYGVASMRNVKKWADNEFWGLGFEWDPQWLLTPEQTELQGNLIDICAKVLRSNAVESDKKLLFPGKSFEALSSFGFVGLIVPRWWGGWGQDPTAAAMVVETIARYGCASTAMCYTMHLGAVAACMLRNHGNAAIERLMRRL